MLFLDSYIVIREKRFDWTIIRIGLIMKSLCYDSVIISDIIINHHVSFFQGSFIILANFAYKGNYDLSKLKTLLLQIVD